MLAVAMPVTRLVAPGPEVAMATPLSRRARIAIGGVGGALLMTRQDVMDILVVDEGVVGGKDGPTRVAKYRVHTLASEYFPNQLCSGALHLLAGGMVAVCVRISPLRIWLTAPTGLHLRCLVARPGVGLYRPLRSAAEHAARTSHGRREQQQEQ